MIGREASPNTLRNGVAATQKLGKERSHSANGDRHYTVTFVELQASARRAAEMVSIFEDAVEYRGEVAGRRIDDAKHLGQSRLFHP
jgi:hypothetical protein